MPFNIEPKVIVAVAAGLLVLYLLREQLRLKEDVGEMERYLVETYKSMAAAASGTARVQQQQKRIQQQRQQSLFPGAPPRNMPLPGRGGPAPVSAGGGSRGLGALPRGAAASGDAEDDILSDLEGAPIGRH